MSHRCPFTVVEDVEVVVGVVVVVDVVIGVVVVLWNRLI